MAELPLATWSPCKKYRYTLRRTWRDAEELERRRRVVTWILLNPSTADETTNDATIRRCIAFAQAWDFDELMIVNAYAWRSTDPRALLTVPDPVGPDNDAAILAACARAELIVCGWGRHLRAERQVALTTLLLPGYHAAQGGRWKLHALARNGDGSPSHPLRLPSSLQPQPFKLWEAVHG